MADGLTTATIQIGGAAIAAAITKVRLHTADPSASSGTTFLTTAADQTVTVASTSGVITVPSTSFTGGAASGAVAGFSVWAGTTFAGYFGRDTGDATFNAAGQYTVTSIAITGTSS